MNPTAIFSKTGKGVQEASGKTSALSRGDRAVLKEIDGKTALASIALKFEKIPADKFYALIGQFDKDGYVREVSSGSQPAAAPSARSAPPPKAPPPPVAGGDDEMDFTQAIKLPPKAAPPAAPKPPPMDLAAASRADAERKAKEQEAFDFKGRQEAELKAKAEAEKKAREEAELKARALAEAKARADGEARARADGEARARAEAEAKARAAAGAVADAEAKVKAAREAAVRMATEVKAKAEAEAKVMADAAAERERAALEKARKDMEEKARRDADELRQRLEAEMKAKLEEERKAREAEDRKRREEEARVRQEEDERRRKEEEARRAKEDAARLAREEQDRKRREEDERRRKEEDERRAKEEAERRAREEADRKRREDEERKRAEEDKRRKEDEERRTKEEAGRRAKEEADRRAKEDADRRVKEDAVRRAKEDEERNAKEVAASTARAAQAASAQSTSLPSIEPVAAPPAPAAGGIADSLLADLDSFGKREEEEQKAKEEAERKAKEDAARKAKAEAERKAKEEAERRAKEDAEKKRREDEERKAKEEAEQRARDEEERQKQEEAERKRKAKEALAAKEAERKATQRAAAAKSAGKGDDDIGVTDDDLDMDDIKKDEKALSATARKAAREREREQAPVAAAGRPRKWGKPVAIALFILMIVGIGALHVMPVSTAEYEKAASDAMGVPVKIGSARLSMITGIEARFEGVSVGDRVKISMVRGYPEIGSLFGAKKSFSRIELEGVSLSQSQLADALFGKVSGENFRVARILIKQAKFDGPLTLPALDVEATVSGDGSLQSVSLRGGDKLIVQLSPKGTDVAFEISAASLALPFVPALNLSEFGMKGTANRAGVSAAEFEGRAFDGAISGSAKIRWGANWAVDGELRARGVRVAVFAPALVSEGKVEGRGTYSMSGPNPARLFESARVQGDFKIDKGVLGSFDLTRALQTGGGQTGGRTIFTELTGQAVYDKATIKISNVAITAGAMNAGASLDIDASGALSGRIVADVKTPNQTLRATLNVSGKIQDPVIRK